MKTTLRWIVHCEQTVLLHLRETPGSPNPPNEWWIMLYALDAVLGDTDIIMKYLQGKQLTLDSQMNLLRKLKDTIMTKSNMVTMNPDLVNEVGLVYNVGGFSLLFYQAEKLLRLSLRTTTLADSCKIEDKEQYEKLFRQLLYCI